MARLSLKGTVVFFSQFDSVVFLPPWNTTARLQGPTILTLNLGVISSNVIQLKTRGVGSSQKHGNPNDCFGRISQELPLTRLQW